MLDRLEHLRDRGSVTDLAFHFAEMMVRLDGRGSDEIALAACLVSLWTSQGNVCVDLTRLSRQSIFDGELTTPPLDAWEEILRSSSVVGQPGENRPLILDNRQRLYLYRYWDYQKRLASMLLSRASLNESQRNSRDFREALDRIMPRSSVAGVDWQRVAAGLAFLKRLCVITGGPGTGKTWTVVRILAALAETAPGGVALRVALTAPTGKAAARLEETLRKAKENLPISPGVRSQIPDVATTIHRLLGVQRYSIGFRHSSQDPLPLDLLIVDEASMVDLPLMTRLVEALPSDSRLILLGDKDQLSSIESGAVFREICSFGVGYTQETAERLARLTGESLPSQWTKSESAIQDCVAVMRTSFRFGKGSGIDGLSKAVCEGDVDRTLAMLNRTFRKAERDIEYRYPPGDLSASLRARMMGHLSEVNSVEDPSRALVAFNRFRILCAVRSGPLGVERVNRVIEDLLRSAERLVPGAVWYRGRPILVTENDYRQGLFNGDLGLTFEDPESPEGYSVYFQSKAAEVRRVSPSRLPRHVTSFALTVHQSQGSEFDEVLLILPVRPAAVLTRELLYTGLTRARKRVSLWAGRAILEATVRAKTERWSGLSDALRSEAPPSFGQLSLF